MTTASESTGPVDRRVNSAISVFDILKIGVGPSSSHTLGPWRAARQFVTEISKAGRLSDVRRVSTRLYGSLAKTGRGHGTGIAVMMGLMDEDPQTCDVELIPRLGAAVAGQGHLELGSTHPVTFDRERDIQFVPERTLDLHPNGLEFCAEFAGGEEMTRRFYSIGGGFVVTKDPTEDSAPVALPHPIERAQDLQEWAEKLGCSLAEVVHRNERFWRGDDEIDSDLLRIKDVMIECVYRGCYSEGILPGGLEVTRRAAGLHTSIMGPADAYPSAHEWFEAVCNERPNFEDTLQWVTCFALAVNEENAAFGRVVTAPTNGAAGVIPAVLLHFLASGDRTDQDAIRFLLVAAEVGAIFKKRSTISAAMGGCQAEIGVSSAMAAAALTEGQGGTPHQALMAAEIAMEHHLGLTCDPIGGLVQVPCIERNALGAMKAITATQMALVGDPNQARVSLDDVIDTMWKTAQDMNTKYKETSEGGLAVQIPVRIIEC